MNVDGQCHCGAIRFVAEVDPAGAAICHCTDCQTLSGSAFRTVVFGPEHAFKLLAGTPTIYVKTAESGNRREQAFCPTCGSPLYARAAGQPMAAEAPAAGAPVRMVGIRVGALRQRDALVPTAQYYCRSAQPWAVDIGGVPRFPRHRDSKRQ